MFWTILGPKASQQMYGYWIQNYTLNIPQQAKANANGHIRSGAVLKKWVPTFNIFRLVQNIYYIFRILNIFKIANISVKGRQPKTNSRYAFAYLVCHALTLINVIVNINLLNAFFEGRFTEFGTRLSAINILFWIVQIDNPLYNLCTNPQSTIFADGWNPQQSSTQSSLMYFQG